jgi:hypothetical protein
MSAEEIFQAIAGQLDERAAVMAAHQEEALAELADEPVAVYSPEEGIATAVIQPTHPAYYDSAMEDGLTVALETVAGDDPSGEAVVALVPWESSDGGPWHPRRSSVVRQDLAYEHIQSLASELGVFADWCMEEGRVWLRRGALSRRYSLDSVIQAAIETPRPLADQATLMAMFADMLFDAVGGQLLPALPASWEWTLEENCQLALTEGSGESGSHDLRGLLVRYHWDVDAVVSVLAGDES